MDYLKIYSASFHAKKRNNAEDDLYHVYFFSLTTTKRLDPFHLAM